MWELRNRDKMFTVPEFAFFFLISRMNTSSKVNCYDRLYLSHITTIHYKRFEFGTIIRKIRTGIVKLPNTSGIKQRQSQVS